MHLTDLRDVMVVWLVKMNESRWAWRKQNTALSPLLRTPICSPFDLSGAFIYSSPRRLQLHVGFGPA